MESDKFDKKIVIVGFSFGGFTIGEFLWNNFKVTFVDAKDHFEYVPTCLKSSIDDKWADKIHASYSDVAKAHEGKFEFIQGTLVEVTQNDSILVQTADAKTEEVSYDYLIISTGFHYDSPIKQDGVNAWSVRSEGLAKFNKEVTEAKNILVVGGGIVGVELVAEIAVANPGDKKVSIATRGDRLLKQAIA